VVIQGISVSSGFAEGHVIILPDLTHASVENVKITDVAAEQRRFENALAKALAQTQDLASKLSQAGKKEQAEIFEAHAMMLQDPELIDQTKILIEEQRVNCAWAFKKVSDQYADMLAKLDDPYLRERANDVHDVASRVLDNLAGAERRDLTHLPDGTVLVGYDITPSQMAVLDPKKVRGIITETGGKTSHTAILARALEIPAVVGLRGLREQLKENQEILIDADHGEVWIEFNTSERENFNKKKQKFESQRLELNQFRGMKSETKDGHRIVIGANIGTPADLPAVEAHDAESVGLYRTEFVFLDKKKIPTENEQYAIYREVFEKLKTKHCIIRTLDIGGDKQLDGLSVPHEDNPFLGLRAVRLCLKEIDIFKNQLRAMLRAAHGHSVGIMIPMISNIDEIIECKKVLAECRKELEARKEPFAEKIEFGVMIEVPSAGLMVDLIARHVDFVSVGTNDLTQYVCAVDRLNDQVEKLYDPFNPGFLRIMNMILGNAKAHNIKAGICGSLAHSVPHVPLFIGMGVHELSMTAQHVLSTRKLLRNLSYKECVELVPRILDLETSAEIQRQLKAFLA
jgi:phosphoenolpyruvate-protein phosphotransferase (PTS system enzyme I)